MRRMTTVAPCIVPLFPTFRGAACSLLPGKVRHSLGNGAMEKGASASALSSTSGDEIVARSRLKKHQEQNRCQCSGYSP